MKNCHLKKKINLCVGSKSLETSNFVCQNQWYHLNFPKTSVLFLKVFFEVSELFFLCVCVSILRILWTLTETKKFYLIQQTLICSRSGPNRAAHLSPLDATGGCRSEKN